MGKLNQKEEQNNHFMRSHKINLIQEEKIYCFFFGSRSIKITFLYIIRKLFWKKQITMLSRIVFNINRRGNSFALVRAYASNQKSQAPTSKGIYGTNDQEFYGKTAEDIKHGYRKEESQAMGDKMQEKFKDWKEKVENKSEDIKEGLQQKYSNVKDKVQDKTSNMKENVQEGVQNMKEEVKDKTKQMYNNASEKGKEYMDQAAQKGKEAMNKMGDMKDSAKENMKDIKDDTKSMGKEAYHRAAAGAESMKRDVDHSFSSDRSWTEQTKETVENMTGIHSTQDLKDKASAAFNKLSDAASTVADKAKSFLKDTDSTKTEARGEDTTKDFYSNSKDSSNKKQ